MDDKTKEKVLEVGKDIALTVVTTAGAAIAGKVTHRISEVKSRRKAKKLAVDSNNEDL